MSRRITRLALAALLAFPAAAQAQSLTLDGDPLNVTADGRGRLQVVYEGATTPEFATDGQARALAGFNLGLYDFAGNPGPVRGFLGPGQGHSSSGEFTNVTPPALTVLPDGRTRLRSVYQVSSSDAPCCIPSAYSAQITEDLLYRNGDDFVTAQYLVRNTATSPPAQVSFRATVSGDLLHNGETAGLGFLGGSPRFAGGLVHALGAAGGLIESTAWQGFEVNGVSPLFGKVRTPGGPGVTGGLNPGPFDDAVGAQWERRGANALPGGGPPSSEVLFEVVWRFPRFNAMTLTPEAGAAVVGDTHNVTVGTDTGGSAGLADQIVHWRTSGANADASGSVTTGPDGSATIPLTADVAGSDTLETFLDVNGNGTVQPNEPIRSATVDWTLPPPERGESFNAAVVEGTVLVAERRPRSGGARSAGLGEFRPLENPEQLRMGSVLDTSDGKMEMTSASNASGTRTQSGKFSGGQMVVRQKEGSSLTELTLRGGDFGRCKSSKRGTPTASVARRTIRRLRGNARGRFRTKGRHSSATVRGTVWTVKETCAGTLTKVKTGSVRVRDFNKSRRVVLRKGKKYLARPSRR